MRLTGKEHKKTRDMFRLSLLYEHISTFKEYMSHYDFINNNGEFYFCVRDWHKVFDLAKEYGWKPKGTSSNRIMKSFAGKWDNWDGNYFSFDSQLVDEDDAKNLAKALRAAIKDIPKRRPNKMSDEMTLLEYWSGSKFRLYLKKFILFCEEGLFIIR